MGTVIGIDVGGSTTKIVGFCDDGGELRLIEVTGSFAICKSE